jgi:formamidopyrimidine-DNA glycosylase
MPELPEVETVRAGLAEFVTGARVTKVEVFDTRSLKRHEGTESDFIATLVGRRIEAAVRRGKFLWLPLSLAKSDKAQLALIGHLGMSGQILLRTPKFEPDKLTRIVLYLTAADGQKYEMRFVDQRIFGSLAIDQMQPTDDGGVGGFSAQVGLGAPWRNLIPAQVAHIARDPLDPEFDEAKVLAAFKKKQSGIKRVLLDQGVLSGIGNIYADESLWLAKLHYDQPAATLSKAKSLELLAFVQKVLAEAVAVGGTSFDEQYKNINGESGYFSQSLNAYGMTGFPCKRCGRAIRRDSWMNRGSHLCPSCQKLRR